MSQRVRLADELTPFERHGALWYKRDDLFVPYDDEPISGGKVRQAIRLLESKADEIRARFGGVVLTATGVHSPQGLIIARVAAQYGLRCVVFLGATSLGGALTRHELVRRVVATGAAIDCRARVAYESALAAAITRWRAEHDDVGYVVKFGINLEDDPAAILGSTAAQVKNLPDCVQRVVVAVGAGVTAAGVILGAAQYRPDCRVSCVQIAGYDRRDAIDRMCGDLSYDWHVIADVPYARHVERSVDAILLDPIYEAKAHDWLFARSELCDERTAFWLVGDSHAVRAPRATCAESRPARSRRRRSRAHRHPVRSVASTEVARQLRA